MTLESYVYAGTTLLRRGYTTGTCAALAAKAAAIELLTGNPVRSVSILTPAGISVDVEVERLSDDAASSAENEPCRVAYSVCKDAGDDFDVTDGMPICARVSLADEGISIDGGEGVGRVTLPGLDQPVGAAAINSGPRAMIADALEDVAAEHGYEGGFSVVIGVPGGAEVAGKTFNAQLGIEGGISILGTTGIVEPQSVEARKDALAVEIHARAACGATRLVITPGNYGAAFLERYRLPADIPVVKCANFIGFALDRAAIEHFEEVLLVGHMGKMVKVAGGIMDTHSRVADCRCEIFAAHAALAGAPRDVIARLFQAATTDACIAELRDCGIANEAIAGIAAAVQERVEHRVAGAYRVGTVLLSNEYGELTADDAAAQMIEAWGGVREAAALEEGCGAKARGAVHFVGAGSGATDLITLRGARLLERADVVIYAGSLVNPELLDLAGEHAEVHDSARMTLGEVIAVMREAVDGGADVVRLHTGDPSLYGAIREQMDALDELGIDYDYTPGVSSFSGAASALKAEYTVPGISQSVIITRMAGRTPVPEGEGIAEMASHGCSMVVFLSTGMLERLSEELVKGAYTADTPAALVYKATWPDERVLRCTVGTLAETARAEGITKTALVCVGDFLAKDAAHDRSLLYDPAFTTGFREATS